MDEENGRNCHKLNLLCSFTIIEHSNSLNIIVEASAGTGKTTVMIDRILYLLSVENADPSKIVMITFTNDASSQMSKRLQDILMLRYHVTKNENFLKLMEKQSQIEISTIHSFAFKLIKNYGMKNGLTKDVSIKSFKYEIDRIIDNTLNEIVKPDARIDVQLGVNHHKARALIHEYWNKLMLLGISDEQFLNVDWGEAIDSKSELLQNSISETLNHIIKEYANLKFQNNAVSLSDMIRDLNLILSNTDCDLGIRYLFVDEFQDSDNSQINAIIKLCRSQKFSLFVVGDIKQSIYRFRGADDSAFDKLLNGLGDLEHGSLGKYILTNNYRTSPKILKNLSICFNQWAKLDLLNYKVDTYASRTDLNDGICDFKIISKYDSIEEILVKDIRNSLDNLRNRIKSKRITESDRVAILVRTNSELLTVSRICKEHGIPLITKHDGDFFKSDAVLDFRTLLSSFLYPDLPHIFNYLLSPYASFNGQIDINHIVSLNGDTNAAYEYLNTFLKDTSWNYYHNMLATKPAMLVLKHMIDEEKILDRYAICKKIEMEDYEFDETQMSQYLQNIVEQYRADLNKLFELIQTRVKNESLDLFSLYNYLELMVQTNREEECANIDEKGNCICAYCITVHSAKGLEFDTVIVPFTDRTFRMRSNSEILVNCDLNKIGWKYKCDDGTILQNCYYKEMRSSENYITIREEARLLYVALTRAMRHLTVYVGESYKKNTWGDLLTEGGAI